MKLDGWDIRLVDYLHGGRNADFVWGQRDCVLLAVDVVLLQTGIDLDAEIDGGVRGTYSSREEALSRLRDLGLTPHSVFDGHFNRVKPAFASRGDVVYRKRENGGTFGVVYGGKAIYRAENGGFVHEPVMLADIVWKIE